MQLFYIFLMFASLFLFSSCQGSSNTVNQNTSDEDNVTTITLFPINKNILFSEDKCSQIIVKTSYITCYDYGLKSITLNAYELDGSKVNAPNPIEVRPDFYSEIEIPEIYRAQYSDYVGYDRGHLRADASSDYDETILLETYSLGANIVAQYSGLNRYVWSDVEIYSRRLAISKDILHVINIPIYHTPIDRNRNNLAIANGFYKILYTDEGSLDDFKECYYYENIQYSDAESTKDTHQEFMVDCMQIKIPKYKTL